MEKSKPFFEKNKNKRKRKEKNTQTHPTVELFVNYGLGRFLVFVCLGEVIKLPKIVMVGLGLLL